VQNGRQAALPQFRTVRTPFRGHNDEITSLVHLEAPSLFCTGSVSGVVHFWDYDGAHLTSLGSAWPKKFPHKNGSIQEIEAENTAKMEEMLEKRKLRFA
jgi:hypothetical protein